MSAHKAVFLVSSGKKQTFSLMAPVEKLLENPLVTPVEKILPTLMHTGMHYCNIFEKKCVALHHLATLFNNTNAVSK